ncbi:hypothetical protein BWQ96_09511 [Gracilariopsis chorda]|uniref:Uncharacterized protein n=1 Tax=Gracilariopsis chorda TaxID=448386 RepID=A0A2V3IF81_9FLOR|nr:hypothetical protein BWQ96_09511 [Gracilariopsis chorda]|eukprot:PXF40749.1 hypothetical protein BWQ96_09511 [Gracilariopsis chorda]
MTESFKKVPSKRNISNFLLKMKFDTDNQSKFARLVRSLLKDSPQGIQFLERLKKRVNPLVLSHEDITKHDNIPRQLEKKMDSMGIALKGARNPIVRVARTIWYEDATKAELEAFMDSYKSHPYAARVMPDDITFSHNLHQNQGDPKPSEDREAAGTEDHTAKSPNYSVTDSGEQTRFDLEDGNEPNNLPQLETTSNSKQMPLQFKILIEDDEITEAPPQRIKHLKQPQQQSENWNPSKDELKLDDLLKAISSMNTRFDSVLDEKIKRMNTLFDERIARGQSEDRGCDAQDVRQDPNAITRLRHPNPSHGTKTGDRTTTGQRQNPSI